MYIYTPEAAKKSDVLPCLSVVVLPSLSRHLLEDDLIPLPLPPIAGDGVQTYSSGERASQPGVGGHRTEGTDTEN